MNRTDKLGALIAVDASMIVIDLRCPQQHRFEGWFASGEEFERQQAAQLVSCPLCGDQQVERLPAAAHVITGGEGRAPAPASAEEVAGKLVQAMAEFVRHTENVGDRFAEEARRIHYKEVPQRHIRGVASMEQAEELREEGIPVVQLPFVPPEEIH